MFIEEWLYQRVRRELEEWREFLRSRRIEVPFYEVQSAKFSKTEQELKAYDMPITKIIEDNSIKEMIDFVNNKIVTAFKIPAEILHGYPPSK